MEGDGHVFIQTNLIVLDGRFDTRPNFPTNAVYNSALNVIGATDEHESIAVSLWDSNSSSDLYPDKTALLVCAKLHAAVTEDPVLEAVLCVPYPTANHELGDPGYYSTLPRLTTPHCYCLGRVVQSLTRIAPLHLNYFEFAVEVSQIVNGERLVCIIK